MQALMDVEVQSYTRKKDDVVMALLDEYEHRHDHKDERRDKWLKPGESPTKRLIRKSISNFTFL